MTKNTALPIPTHSHINGIPSSSDGALVVVVGVGDGAAVTGA